MICNPYCRWQWKQHPGRSAFLVRVRPPPLPRRTLQPARVRRAVNWSVRAQPSIFPCAEFCMRERSRLCAMPTPAAIALRSENWQWSYTAWRMLEDIQRKCTFTLPGCQQPYNQRCKPIHSFLCCQVLCSCWYDAGLPMSWSQYVRLLGRCSWRFRFLIIRKIYVIGCC